MNESLLPSYEDMHNAVLEALKDGKPHARTEIYDIVSDSMGIPDEARSITTSNGIPKHIGRIGWSISYLNQAMLIERSKRATYRLTNRGKDALSTGQKIDNDYLRRFPEFLEFEKRSSPKVIDTSHKPTGTVIDDYLTPEERIEHALAEINDKLVHDLLTEINEQGSDFFEKLVVDVMEAIYGGDFSNSGEVTPRSNDGGIDGIVKQDRLGFNNIYIQAKKWKGNVSRPEIQNFSGAMDGVGATNGAFITSSKFTDGCRDFVKTVMSTKHIILIDGEDLARLMIEYGIGVSARKSINLNKVDYDYFHPEG